MPLVRQMSRVKRTTNKPLPTQGLILNILLPHCESIIERIQTAGSINQRQTIPDDLTQPEPNFATYEEQYQFTVSELTSIYLDSLSSGASYGQIVQVESLILSLKNATYTPSNINQQNL